MDIIVVRVLIKPSHGTFQFNGTAFFLNNKTLITAKHVVENAIKRDYEIYISDIPNGGKLFIPHEDIKLCSRDIAVLNSKKSFDVPPIETSHSLKEGCAVYIEGYHNENGAKGSFKHHVSSYRNSEHTYELQSHLTNGLSGSPVLLEGKICGIAQAIHRKDNITFVIPISELCIEVTSNLPKKNNELQSHKEEIEQHIQNNNLDMASKRAMDFVSHFSKNQSRRREAINIRAKYNALRQDLREQGSSEKLDKKTHQLSNQILDFIYAIEEERQQQPKASQNSKTPRINSMKKQKRVQKIQRFSSYSTAKKKFEQSKKASLLEKHPQAVFVAEGLTKNYRHKISNFTLKPIDLELNYGEITVVVGENGNGKTTLLNIIAGALKHSEGEIAYPQLINDKQNDWYHIKTQIAYIEQRLPKWKNIASYHLHFTLGINGITGQANIDEVNFIMHRLGLENYVDRRWSELSAGYKMRFALAQALLRKPKLLILDEPLANLDINTQQLFLNDLRHLTTSREDKMSVIVSSQHLYELEAIADKIIFLSDGKTLYHGKMHSFGKKREHNSYEFQVEVEEKKLIEALKKIGHSQLQQEGQNYILTTARSVGYQEILNLFLTEEIPLLYFRDISKSTRKLFGEIK